MDAAVPVLPGATTFTATVHEPPPAIEPPVKVMDASPATTALPAPLGEASVPALPVPVQVMLAFAVGAMTMPAGKVSVKVDSGTATVELGLFSTTLKRVTSAA